jgi:lysozyme
MKILHIDGKGIDLITSFEGFRAKPYICPAGVPTIGYGTTRYPNGVKVSMSDMEITKDKAIEYLRFDVYRFELAVDAMCVDSINQNQFNALVSFTYNLGEGALKSSTLLKKLNVNPNDLTIKDEFQKWCFADGKKMEGLLRRRIAEAELYFTPIQIV